MPDRRDVDPLRRIQRWYLLTGSREVLSALLLLALTALVWVLIRSRLLYVGPESMLPSLLSSGMFSGLMTLLTVALSINQLVLSRVFGSPNELGDRLDGNLEFRGRIEEVVGVATSPNDPGSFLALVGEELQEQGAELQRSVDESYLEDVEEFDEFTNDLVDYGHHLGQAGDEDDTVDVLNITIGNEYARHLKTARWLASSRGANLPADASEHLDQVIELLKGVAIVRQFFKTLAIQQDLAVLSRRLIYTGLLAIVTTYCLTIVYTSSSSVPTTLSTTTMPLVVTVATPLMFAPLALLVTYLLRVATISLYTVSVGSFVPPEEPVGE